MTDREMMQRRASWPQWPYLPLKRTRNGVQEFAVLYASQPLRVSYDANLFDLQGAKWVRVTVNRLIADGWQVD